MSQNFEENSNYLNSNNNNNNALLLQNYMNQLMNNQDQNRQHQLNNQNNNSNNNLTNLLLNITKQNNINKFINQNDGGSGSFDYMQSFVNPNNSDNFNQQLLGNLQNRKGNSFILNP